MKRPAAFSSLPVEEELEKQLATGPAVGIDLGIAQLATTSDGRSFANPRALQISLERLARLNRQLYRCEKGSRNRAETRTRLARLHTLSHRLFTARGHPPDDRGHRGENQARGSPAAVVVIETLNVAGIMQNEKLARAMADVGMSEFSRQMAYKCHWSGSRLMQVDCWFPSSKRCSGCGQVRADFSLSDRVYRCLACGLVMDRDLNAAQNLAQLATGSFSGSNACGDGGSCQATRFIPLGLS